MIVLSGIILYFSIKCIKLSVLKLQGYLENKIYVDNLFKTPPTPSCEEGALRVIKIATYDLPSFLFLDPGEDRLMGIDGMLYLQDL